MRANRLVVFVWALVPLVGVADEPLPSEPPSMALLEYLGEWQDVEGHEIDPQALAMMQLEPTQGRGESYDEE